MIRISWYCVLSVEEAVVQPASTVVAAGAYCPSNSQIFVVQRAIPLQDIYACLCVLKLSYSLDI
jgi:hypothetical protein